MGSTSLRFSLSSLNNKNMFYTTRRVIAPSRFPSPGLRVGVLFSESGSRLRTCKSCVLCAQATSSPELPAQLGLTSIDDGTLHQLSNTLLSSDLSAGDVESALLSVNLFIHRIPAKSRGAARVTHAPAAANVNADVKRILFASGDYLGLANEPQLKEVAAAAAFKHGVGNVASSVIGGSSVLHRELTQVLCRFTNASAAMVFPGCAIANFSVICALVGVGDVVILDMRAHATLQAAVKMSGARIVLVQSNNPGDLDKKLQREERRVSAGAIRGKILVVSDSVFSVEGSIYNLPEARRLCDQYGAMLLLDEAHSFGVIGANGRGIEEHFNMWGACDVRIGTFGKGLGGFPGGFAVSPNPELFLDPKLVYSLGYAFSTNMSPISTAVAKAAVELVLLQPSRVAKLQENAKWLRSALMEEGFDVGDSQTAVVPLVFEGAEAYMGALIPPMLVKEYNIYVVNFCWPAIAKGTTAVRILVNFHHTREDMALLCRALVDVRTRLRQLGAKRIT